jgi:UDP-N-acetylmuramate dehydrogenase
VTDIGAALRARFGADRVRAGVPLGEFTTFKTGGPARWFLETRTGDEMVDALRIASGASVPAILLGGGSNVLVSDSGVNALVIRPKGGEVRQLSESLVRADAAMTINGLVRWTILHALAGVEAWAGTPGTVGGAVFGNAHFGGRLISELIASVRLARPGGVVADVAVEALGFGYDQSRLGATGEVVLSADFKVAPGDPTHLRSVARQSLAYRKRTQPLDMPSAGCVFQNPQHGRDVVPAGIPWSAGALVDRAGLKGRTIGGARVSATHGNFIVNDAAATAADIRRLIELCRTEVRRQFGVDLREEIVYLGDFSGVL